MFAYKRSSLTLWLHGSKHPCVRTFVGTCVEQVDVLGSQRVNQRTSLQFSLAPLEMRLLLNKVRAKPLQSIFEVQKAFAFIVKHVF